MAREITTHDRKERQLAARLTGTKSRRKVATERAEWAFGDIDRAQAVPIVVALGVWASRRNSARDRTFLVTTMDGSLGTDTIGVEVDLA